MEFQTVRALHGPNIWSKSPVLEVFVDLGELRHRRSHEIPGFCDRLLAWLPSLNTSPCSSGTCEPFFDQLRNGACLAQVLERVAAELQHLAGSGTGFSRTRPTDQPGVAQVLVGFTEESVVRATLQTARALCRAAIAGETFDVAEEVDQLRSLDQQIRLGPSTGSIVRAAHARGIPTRRLNEGSLVQLGFGARQHRILAAETDQTSAIAETIAQDKELTKTLLRAIGVPVPEGRPVESAEDAWEAACDIRTPVVVKPQYGNHGRGVAVNLTTQEQILAAYEAAHDEGSAVIVERFAPGSDHRMLVVGNRLIAAARREPPQVTGNGQHTIAELVEEINRDPRRGEDHATPLSKLNLDAIALGVLAEQGLTPESVLPEGQVVPIRRNANLSTGGSAVDVTDLVHPEVAARAVDAARVIGLDVAGVDIVAVDVSRTLEEQGGVVVEVNAGPGLRMHLEPSAGTPRLVGEAIVETMFPAGDDGRIPIVSVTGGAGTTATARCLAHLLNGTEKRVGLACVDGIFVNEHRADSYDCSGSRGARLVLLNPQVEAAVLEISASGVVHEGLGFDRCAVAIVTHSGESSASRIAGSNPDEELTAAIRIVIESVAPNGTAILNADDPRAVALAPHSPSEILYFANEATHPVLLAHRKADGRVASLQQGSLVLAKGATEIRIALGGESPSTGEGATPAEIERVLASAAAAWVLGVPEELIRTGLATFASDTIAGQPAHRWDTRESNAAEKNGHAAGVSPVTEKLGSN